MKNLLHFSVTSLIHGILRLLCRVDDSELQKIPRKGPCLLIMNHVNFLEVPMVYTCLQPRRVFSLLKEETWNNPFFAFLANTWDGIPLKRGTADFSAFSSAERVFDEGHMLIMAPEGTRSKTGILQKAHAGAVLLAHHNDIPVYPIAHTGGQLFGSRFKKLKRTDFTFKVGEPFKIKLPEGVQLDSTIRKEITNEFMNRIAVLLPDWQRGKYTETADNKPVYLEFVSASGDTH